MHCSLCVGVILCLVSAIGVGSVFRISEYRTMEPTDEQRLRWVAGMDQSEWWVQERVFAQMLAFDSSTEEGMGKFKDFINKVKRGGTGTRGRNNFVPTPAPCNGAKIELGQESIVNPLQLHMIGYGNDISKAQRASTNSPTSNVVLQKERYFAFKFDGKVTTALNLQCLVIKHATGLVMDENEYRPSVQERRKEEWEACMTRTGGNDYYRLDLPQIAAKFWDVFGLQEDIDPEQIQEQSLEDVIDKLYAMLWQSHVLPPPPGLPTVLNQQTAVVDVDSDNRTGS